MATVSISDKTFETMVLNAKKPVLVDFWAEWCGPCKAIAPAIEEISVEKENLIVAKINIDDNPESPSKYGVRGIPTLMIFKDGQLIDTKVGSIPKSKILEWINSLIV
tara:strand:+ start:787 stop:1107 length:321 start_codon:yes stop_codon:yes gene_type:complete